MENYALRLHNKWTRLHVNFLIYPKSSESYCLLVLFHRLTVPNSPVGSVLAANMDPAPQENNLFLLDAPPSQFTNELQIWNFVAV